MFPNVPHIVGDDDDLDQANDKQEMPNANLNCDPNSRDDIAKTSDLETSCSSESLNEDESEAGSFNSPYDTTEAAAVEDEEEQEEDDGENEPNEPEEQDAEDGEEDEAEDEDEEDEEEEDWSNNVSYLDCTPERVSSSTEGFGILTKFIEDYPTEAKNVQYLNVDVDSEDVYVHSLIDGFKDNADVELMEPNANTAPITIEDLELLPNQPVEVQPNSVELENSGELEPKLEETSVRKPKTSDKAVQPKDPPNPKLEESSAQSRRQSLRSASRSAAPIESHPAAKQKRLDSRSLKTKDSSLPPPKAATITTFGAPSASKRGRRSLANNKSIVLGKKQSRVQLARPIDVTDYFTQISANLVSERVNLLPFQHLREQVDRLVAEATAKSKIQRK